MQYTPITAKLPAMPAEARLTSVGAVLDLIRARFCVPEAGDKTNPVYDYLRGVSNAIFDPTRWKNPIKVVNAIELTAAERAWIGATIIWYHGAEPIETPAAIYSPGYVCD